MKTIHSILAVALVVSALPAFAQDAPPPAPAAPQGQFEKGRHGPGGRLGDLLESLTPAEREQYLAARRKSRNDPAVVEARKKVEEATQALADATKAAMLKVDPTVAPVLEKVEAAIKEKKEEMQERRSNLRLP